MNYMKEKKNILNISLHGGKTYRETLMCTITITTIKDLTISRLASQKTILTPEVVVHVNCSICLPDCWSNQVHPALIQSTSFSCLTCLHFGPHSLSSQPLWGCFIWLPCFRMYVCSCIKACIYIGRNTQWVLMYVWSYTCLYENLCECM